MTAAQATSARLVAAGLRRRAAEYDQHVEEKARVVDLLKRAWELERDANETAAGEAAESERKDGE